MYGTGDCLQLVGLLNQVLARKDCLDAHLNNDDSNNDSESGSGSDLDDEDLDGPGSERPVPEVGCELMPKTTDVWMITVVGDEDGGNAQSCEAVATMLGSMSSEMMQFPGHIDTFAVTCVADTTSVGTLSGRQECADIAGGLNELVDHQLNNTLHNCEKTSPSTTQTSTASSTGSSSESSSATTSMSSTASSSESSTPSTSASSTASSTATATESSTASSTMTTSGSTTQTSSASSTLPTTASSSISTSQSSTMVTSQSSSASTTMSTSATISATSTASSTASSTITSNFFGRLRCSPHGILEVAGGAIVCDEQVEVLNELLANPSCQRHFITTSPQRGDAGSGSGDDFGIDDSGNDVEFVPYRLRCVRLPDRTDTYAIEVEPDQDSTTEPPCSVFEVTSYTCNVVAAGLESMVHEATQFPGDVHDIGCLFGVFAVNAHQCDAAANSLNYMISELGAGGFQGCEITSPTTTVTSTASSTGTTTASSTFTTTASSTPSTAERVFVSLTIGADKPLGQLTPREESLLEDLFFAMFLLGGIVKRDIAIFTMADVGTYTSDYDATFNADNQASTGMPTEPPSNPPSDVPTAMPSIEDINPPTIVSYSVDMSVGTVLLDFSESVDVSSLDPAQFYLQYGKVLSMFSTDFTSLAGAVVSSTTQGKFVTLTMSAETFLTITSKPGLASSKDTTWLSVKRGAVRDLATNSIVEIAANDAMQGTTYQAAPSRFVRQDITVFPIKGTAQLQSGVTPKAAAALADAVAQGVREAGGVDAMAAKMLPGLQFQNDVTVTVIVTGRIPPTAAPSSSPSFTTERTTVAEMFAVQSTRSDGSDAYKLSTTEVVLITLVVANLVALAALGGYLIRRNQVGRKVTPASDALVLSSNKGTAGIPVLVRSDRQSFTVPRDNTFPGGGQGGSSMRATRPTKSALSTAMTRAVKSSESVPPKYDLHDLNGKPEWRTFGAVEKTTRKLSGMDPFMSPKPLGRRGPFPDPFHDGNVSDASDVTTDSGESRDTEHGITDLHLPKLLKTANDSDAASADSQLTSGAPRTEVTDDHQHVTGASTTIRGKSNDDTATKYNSASKSNNSAESNSNSFKLSASVAEPGREIGRALRPSVPAGNHGPSPALPPASKVGPQSRTQSEVILPSDTESKSSDSSDSAETNFKFSRPHLQARRNRGLSNRVTPPPAAGLPRPPAPAGRNTFSQGAPALTGRIPPDQRKQSPANFESARRPSGEFALPTEPRPAGGLSVPPLKSPRLTGGQRGPIIPPSSRSNIPRPARPTVAPGTRQPVNRVQQIGRNIAMNRPGLDKAQH